MNIDTILFVGFGFFLVLIFLIIYLKDLESNRKFERFARAIEDINRQNHKIRQIQAKKNEQEDIWLNDVKLEIHKKVQDEINTKVLPLLDSLEEIEEVIKHFKADQQTRLSQLEQRTKSINNLSQSSQTSNEKQITQAYDAGKKIFEIAKDLRISMGEVEFVLKMNKLI